MVQQVKQTKSLPKMQNIQMGHNVDEHTMITNFDDDLAFSISDPVRKMNYQIIAREFPVKKFHATEQDGHHQSNDVIAELSDGRIVRIEIKNRRAGSAWDVPIEIFQDVSKESLGWAFRLQQDRTDYVLWSWQGKKKNCYLIVDAVLLQDWWQRHYRDYPMKVNKVSVRESAGTSWQSSYAFVPVRDLPSELVLSWHPFVDLGDYGAV